MSKQELNLKEKMNIEEIMDNLENYRPRRRGWHWREGISEQEIGPFTYKPPKA